MVVPNLFQQKNQQFYQNSFVKDPMSEGQNQKDIKKQNSRSTRDQAESGPPVDSLIEDQILVYTGPVVEGEIMDIGDDSQQQISVFDAVLKNIVNCFENPKYVKQIFRAFKNKYKRKGRPRNSKRLTKTLKYYWQDIKPKMLQLIRKSIIDLNELIIQLDEIQTALGRSWFFKLIQNEQLKPHVLECLTTQSYQKILDSFMNRQDERRTAYRNNRIPLIVFCQEGKNNQGFRNWYHLQHLPKQYRS